MVSKMFGASLDFSGTFGDKRLKTFEVRVASYSGYFARHFKDKPTPKQYFVCGPCLNFVKKWRFSGYADEEPMESNHAVWNIYYARWKSMLNKQAAYENCMSALHVRNYFHD